MQNEFHLYYIKKKVAKSTPISKKNSKFATRKLKINN